MRRSRYSMAANSRHLEPGIRRIGHQHFWFKQKSITVRNEVKMKTSWAHHQQLSSWRVQQSEVSERKQVYIIIIRIPDDALTKIIRGQDACKLNGVESEVCNRAKISGWFQSFRPTVILDNQRPLTMYLLASHCFWSKRWDLSKTFVVLSHVSG